MYPFFKIRKNPLNMYIWTRKHVSSYVRIVCVCMCVYVYLYLKYLYVVLSNWLKTGRRKWAREERAGGEETMVLGTKGIKCICGHVNSKGKVEARLPGRKWLWDEQGLPASLRLFCYLFSGIKKADLAGDGFVGFMKVTRRGQRGGCRVQRRTTWKMWTTEPEWEF